MGTTPLRRLRQLEGAEESDEYSNVQREGRKGFRPPEE